MADLENVVEHLYDCLAASKPENMWVFVRKGIVGDVIALLKKQEAVEPIPYHRSDGTIFKYECRQCRTKIFKMDLFCRRCGKPVKWNDG